MNGGYLITKNGNGMPVRTNNLIREPGVSTSIIRNNSNVYTPYSHNGIMNSEVIPHVRTTTPFMSSSTGRFLLSSNSARPSLCPICDHICIHTSNQNTDNFISTSM